MALAALNTAAVLELEGRAVESEQRYIQVLDAIRAEVWPASLNTHSGIKHSTRLL
jgi:hypothetical protein